VKARSEHREFDKNQHELDSRFLAKLRTNEVFFIPSPKNWNFLLPKADTNE
jgi:hypothetical protein